ncbi:MAG: ferredoxin reductase family protein [Mycobacteriales bacterium]
MTAIFDPSISSGRRNLKRKPKAVRRPARPRPWVPIAFTVAVATGLVLVVLTGVAVERHAELVAPGGAMTFVGSLTGLIGMYFALVMVLLASRIPPIERVLGQDGVLRWHRRVGPWTISLLVVHALTITLGYAQAAKVGFLHEVAPMVGQFPDVLAATVGLGLMVMAGIASIRAIRNRMRRETWWAIHLYMYLALALSFAHVLLLGPSFVGHPLTQFFWSLVWAATAGLVLTYRFGLPISRSLRHRIRVVEVHQEAEGVVSVVCSGKDLERLPMAGGQFIFWRFLARGLWWQAHPYSVSSLPRPPYLRLTVKEVGDHSRAVAKLRPGTRVVIEGPYGAFTSDNRRNPKVALLAAGIGVTALRSLLEDLPKGADPTVIVRARNEARLPLRKEITELVRHRRGTLHELLGTRSEIQFDAALVRRLVPDAMQRDFFICGPPSFVSAAEAVIRELGVPRSSIHHEAYAL